MWCWRRLLRVPWIAGRSNQSILKEINPEYSLEGLMLKPKLQYFATLREKLTHWKRRWCWERLRAGGKGLTEDEMAGWFYQLNGHSLSKFQEVVKDREAWHAAVHEAAKNEKQFSKWTTTKKKHKKLQWSSDFSTEQEPWCIYTETLNAGTTQCTVDMQKVFINLQYNGRNSSPQL